MTALSTARADLTHPPRWSSLTGRSRLPRVEPPPPSGVRLATLDPSVSRDRDASLVRAALEGDDRAAREIVVRYAPLVRHCLGASFSAVDLDDHVQEVLARCFQHLSRLRDPSALRSYLLGITLRVAAGERRRARLPARERLTATGEVPEGRAPEVAFETEQVIGRMHTLLGRLRPETVRLLRLRYVDQEELVAVADAVGVSLATVKRQLASASAAIRALAEGEPAVREYVRSDCV